MNHSGLFANSEWIRVKPETPLHRQAPLFSSYFSFHAPHPFLIQRVKGKEACLREPLIAEFLELRVINPQFGRRHNSSFLARFLRAPRVSHCTDTIMDCQRHALESLDNQETIWSRKKSGFDHLSGFWNQKKNTSMMGRTKQNGFFKNLPLRLLQVDSVLVLLCLCLCSFEGW